MTVVIAVRCANGVLMASDSQATEGEGNVRRETQKIFPLGQTAVWGGAGAGQIIRDIGLALPPHHATIAASPDPVLAIAQIAQPVYMSHYAMHVQVPGQVLTSPGTTLLACGMDPAGQPWIGEVSAHLEMTHYEEIGFHAIGSGAGFAQLAAALMAHSTFASARSTMGSCSPTGSSTRPSTPPARV